VLSQIVRFDEQTPKIMKIKIKDTGVGSKPSEKIAEIISRLNKIDDAATLCSQLDLINLENEEDDVSI
jgi:hypothetical protein